MLLYKKKRDSFVSLKKHCITTVIYLRLPFPFHVIQQYNDQQAVHQTNPLI